MKHTSKIGGTQDFVCALEPETTPNNLTLQGYFCHTITSLFMLSWWAGVLSNVGGILKEVYISGTALYSNSPDIHTYFINSVGLEKQDFPRAFFGW